MKDITPVVKAAKRIEALLEEKFGARGRGLHAMAASRSSCLEPNGRQGVRTP